MIINTAAIYDKTQSERPYLNESLWVQAKSPSEKLDFYTRSKILVALYTKALEAENNQKSSSRRSFSLLNSNGITQASAQDIIERLEMRYKIDITKCPYILGPVDCGRGSVVLEVCLKNVMEFDSLEFDKIYGENAAVIAINNYIENMSKTFNVISLNDEQKYKQDTDSSSMLSAMQQNAEIRSKLRADAGLFNSGEDPMPKSPLEYFGRKSPLIFSGLSSSSASLQASPQSSLPATPNRRSSSNGIGNVFFRKSTTEALTPSAEQQQPNRKSILQIIKNVFG